MLKNLRKRFSYTAYTWGNPKTNGHLEKGRLAKSSPIQPIESLRGQITKIGFSSKHAAAITTDGKLFTWGDKKYGKLGLSITSNTPRSWIGNLIQTSSDSVSEPREVLFFSKNNIKIKDFALARNHTIVLDTEGRVYSFGKGAFSKSFAANLLFSEYIALGHSKAEHVSKPKQIEKLRDFYIDQISTGNHFSMAVASNGELFVWGRGEFGVLGCGNKQVPEPIINPVLRELRASLKISISKIKSCADFSSILMSDGSIVSFGNNDEGVMGIGRNMGVDFCEVVNMPTHMEFLDGPKVVVDLDLSETSGVVLTNEGKLYQTGQKLFFNPELVKHDYSKSKVKSFCAFYKGIGFIGEDNSIYTKGEFWPISDQVDEDFETGISRIKLEGDLQNKEIVEIGNRFGETKYVLVKE